MLKKVMILVEKAESDSNFIGYVPAIRLGVVGDTAEEVLENAKDLIMLELERYKAKGKPFPEDHAVIESIEIELG